MNKLKYLILFGLLFVLALVFITKVHAQYSEKTEKRQSLFSVQSIDTMKYSRDEARKMPNNQYFNSIIDSQMKFISDAGATHVAIDTPYDEEFIPILTRWVASARSHGLSVWFRGNFSGWEGWFKYSQITPDEHKNKLIYFIKNHPNLFENGDIFMPCPECENGGPGDPRITGKKIEYQNFITEEYNISNKLFSIISKSVKVYYSMNADIARLIITPEVAKKLGGSIMIDHYVKSSDQLSFDIKNISKILNSNIGLGEFGAPIPDINGSMSDKDQAKFVNSLLEKLYNQQNEVSTINYWVLQGGSTALIDKYNNPKEAYYVLQNYFKAPYISGKILDKDGNGIAGTEISVASTTYTTTSDINGEYRIFLPTPYRTIVLNKNGYETITKIFPNNIESSNTNNIYLERSSQTKLEMLKKIILDLYQQIKSSQNQILQIKNK